MQVLYQLSYSPADPNGSRRVAAFGTGAPTFTAIEMKRHEIPQEAALFRYDPSHD